ncbi:hypothetical protein B0A58_02630 [Flavobacterium branchiophilum NBRC 15030 = ATCC 35035]|uniref:Methylamine utilisation protein MauE domain-containing protein n=1 Tax=Flavobacterium branchiophilum TaxID=55197 RepID=A0A543G677_9FLAO|nr:hypothetical protein B0A58_02630 [Flavobacterium branchiophilum NBRC 15030 = ATCC 35035]TQM41588.1 hypothetical protein BC670_2573 [Flavobacterium branchiophilum]
MSNKKLIAESIYLLLIFFFSYTSINKLMNLDSFRTNLIKTTLFSEEFANIFSVIIIIIEISIILLLIISKMKGLLVFCFLILSFTLYISFLRYKGLYEICGCGGILNGLSYKYHILINIRLIISSLYSFYIFNYISDEK